MKVLIIGAGVAGLAIGWRLRQAGADVTILERAQPAHGASWAAAGMIAVAGEMGGAQTAEAEYGHHSSALWPDFARELEAASGQEIFYRRSGALMIARTPQEAAAFDRWSGVDRLTAAQSAAKEPMLTADIAGGIWAPDDAYVDNRALGAALAAAFVRSGGSLISNEAVVEFHVESNRAVAVATPFRRHEADVFILAAGAWSSQIGGLPVDVLPPVKPVKGEIIAVKPPPGVALPNSIVWGNGIYLVPRTDRLLIGATATESGFDTALSDGAVDWLSSRAIALMPALRRWEVIEHWAGLRPGSPDGMPILGPTKAQGLFAATGQYRNGILFAPAIAETMSRLVLEQAEGPPAFDPRRFS